MSVRVCVRALDPPASAASFPRDHGRTTEPLKTPFPPLSLSCLRSRSQLVLGLATVLCFAAALVVARARHALVASSDGTLTRQPHAALGEAPHRLARTAHPPILTLLCPLLSPLCPLLPPLVPPPPARRRAHVRPPRRPLRRVRLRAPRRGRGPLWAGAALAPRGARAGASEAEGQVRAQAGAGGGARTDDARRVGAVGRRAA